MSCNILENYFTARWATWTSWHGSSSERAESGFREAKHAAMCSRDEGVVCVSLERTFQKYSRHLFTDFAHALPISRSLSLILRLSARSRANFCWSGQVCLPYFGIRPDRIA